MRMNNFFERKMKITIRVWRGWRCVGGFKLGGGILRVAHVRVRLKRLQLESGVNPGFGSANDEGFDKGELVHSMGEHGEQCGCRFLVLALVERVDDDQHTGLCCPEWADDEILRLRAKSFFSNVGARCQDQK